ncbi:MAG: Guanylate cyclase protein [Gammaproteobacteria bacterium]|nr:Guanylate cyclase protein [Gammaproteobacteria bacterium]
MQQTSDARELDLALLFTDLSGYTALTEIHGALTASDIVLQFCRLAQACLEPGVRFINSIGDDVFCAGDDALAVVGSALKLRDAAENEPYFPRIRMGIHRGPIIEREGRLFGAPINLTSRLADNAQGGQILCSAPIAEAVRVLAEIEVRPAGERHFKNVARPVSVFELVRSVAARVPGAVDPVCRMQVEIGRAVAVIEYAGAAYFFCSPECARAFRESPDIYLAA